MKKRILFFFGCLAVSASVAGERLYNAIVLPDQWPPDRADAAAVGRVPYLEKDGIPAVIPVDVGRQLFVDDFLIEELDGVERVFPELRSVGGRVFDAGGKGAFSVWRDSGDGVFKMWYDDGRMGAVRLATSTDGVVWEPAATGISGAVFADQAMPADLTAESWSVVADSVNLVAGEKWKMLVRGPGAGSPCVAMVSADGVNWKRRALAGETPGPASAFFNPFRRKWVFSAGGFSSRTGGSGSPDMRNYYETFRFLKGKCDSPLRWMQADGFSAVAYESLMLGLTEKKTPGGASERRFVYSRDGFHWSEGGSRPVLPAAGDVKMAGNLCVVENEKLRFYYDDGRGGKKIAELRRDGFAGLKAVGRGIVTTRRIIFRGDRLFVNVDAPSGRLSVEVLDEDGRRLPYSGGSVSGDHTKKEILFSEGTMSRITGKPVRFRFTLENCVLYSFWTSASRSGASGGYLAGGGSAYPRLRDVTPLYGENIDAVDVLSGDGEAFRGATVPSGTVQLAPRTVGADGKAAAYRYSHRTIEGFGFVRGDDRLLAMPLTGSRYRAGGRRSRFSHDREKAELGYYMVDLLDDGIRAEMTASADAGVMRFTYPGNRKRLVLFASGGTGAPFLRQSGDRALECSLPGNDGKGPLCCRIEFSEPLAALRTDSGGVLIAEFSPGETPLVMKAGFSRGSAAEAGDVLSVGAAGRSFREVHDEARRRWAEKFTGVGTGDATARYRELVGAPALAPDVPTVEKSKAWKFFDRRLGMFVHWGIYSVGAWHEQEWMRRRMSREDYLRYAGRFTASAFDADALVAVAESAGAEYIVVTTKHHDGFCMWDTETTDFSSMYSSSARDLIGEIAAACRRRGIRLGFYYSNPDWHHPSAYNALSTHQLVDAQPGHVPDMKHYLGYVRRQIRELMTNYGEICCLFWDIPTRIEVPELNEMVRALQPGIVINDRGWGSSGDYSTPEREVPPGSAFPRPTEACDSIGVHSWGYRENEDYRTLGYLTRAIDRMLSRGGNFLLNVGPKSDGSLPEEAVEIMKRVGRWYGKVRESYKDVETVPGLTGGDAIVTRRGDTVYLHYPNGIHSAGLNLSPLCRMPRKAEILNTGTGLRPVLEALPGAFFAGSGKTLSLSGVPAEELSGESAVVKIDF